MTDIPILLPESFGESNFLTPYEVLQKQVEAFSLLTKGVLSAEVIHQIYSYPDMVTEKPYVFYDDFYIVAPLLEDYRYSLLRIGQTNSTYPAEVWDYPQGRKKEVKNADELITELKTLFSSDSTRKIIQSLIHQSRTNPRLKDELPF